MDQLPTDIVRAIAGAVDRKDILSFRLTCRSFAALGLSRQFEVIPVMLFRHSLDNLRRISENPVYRNYVLTIEYGPCIVAHPLARRDWTRTAEYNHEGSYSRFSESEVEQAYESHVRYYSDQGHMISSGYDFNTLQSAVSCLPNLRGVHIKWSDPTNWFKTPRPSWGDAFCNMAKVIGTPDLFTRWRPRNYARDITAVFAAFKFASRSLTWFDCETFELGLLGRDGTEDVYEDDYVGGTVRLTTFDYFVRDRPVDLGFPLVCAIFESLTSVELKFLLQESRDYGSCQQHLGTALRGAQGLETLCIQDNSFRSRDMYPLSFTSLLGSSTWPRLKRLSLKCFNIHEHDFPSFFARHPSLHTFTLDDAFANDFDWATLLQSESLASRWRQLHSLTLSGIWSATNWVQPFMKELKARFHYKDYDVPSSPSFSSTFCLWEPFGKWAKDVSGACDSRELLERYFAAGAGEEGVPFPLRTIQEVVDAVAQEVADGCWFPPRDVMYMLLATERLVEEQYRSRDMFAEYYEVGDEYRSYGMFDDEYYEDGERVPEYE